MNGAAVEEESPGATDDEDVDHPLVVKRKRILDSDSEDDTGDENKRDENLFLRQEFLYESSMPPLRLDSIGESNSPDPDMPPSLPTLQGEPSTDLPADSGLGRSYEEGEDIAEEEEEEEGTRDEGKGESIAVVEEDSNATVGDIDSLEWSFQWGQSLPPAQPFNPSSGDVARPAISRGDTTRDIWEEEESQVMPTESSQSQYPSQSMEDGETQFLDEDG
jgi:hypothetical protein